MNTSRPALRRINSWRRPIQTRRLPLRQRVRIPMPSAVFLYVKPARHSRREIEAADSDDAARLFRDDPAHCSGMISPT
jgi:hypothetical protein